MNPNSSKETQQEALKVAKSIQKPGQTKEQTKLIAQGIEKGISEYKKQQKAKARERDKQRKQQLKVKSTVGENEADPSVGKISISSPIGAGLKGKKKGAVVLIDLPMGEIEYKIESVS